MKWKIVKQESYLLLENRKEIVLHVLLPDGRKILCPDNKTAHCIVRSYNRSKSWRAMRKALQGILGIGKRDFTDPKYERYFDSAKVALALAEKEGST